MIKKSYSVNLTSEVSNEEKQQADQALICFDHASKQLEEASNYLNIMKTPFKENQDMQSDDLMKARVAIRRFRDQAIDNFNKFKYVGFQCVNAMHVFSADTQTIKLIKSFISAVDDLQVKVNKFSELFDDLQNKEFATKVIDYIDKIQKQCTAINEIIDERIKTHIKTNILSKNWVNSVSDELQLKIEEKTPLMLDLNKQRQDQLSKIMRDK
jgi:hypothetical protein